MGFEVWRVIYVIGISEVGYGWGKVVNLGVRLGFFFVKEDIGKFRISYLRGCFIYKMMGRF